MKDEVIDDTPRGIDELCRQAARLVETAPGSLTSLRVQDGDMVVALEWSAPAGQATIAAPTTTIARPGEDTPDSPDPAGADDGLFTVEAPLVGTFYRSPSPGAPPFVDVGDQVVAGQQVAIVEAMKLMNSVEVDRPGRIVDVRVADGSAVEYSEVLFVLAPV